MTAAPSHWMVVAALSSPVMLCATSQRICLKCILSDITPGTNTAGKPENHADKCACWATQLFTFTCDLSEPRLPITSSVKTL